MTGRPNNNPANDGNLTGLLDMHARRRSMDTHDQLPAKVISYDPDTNRVAVEPLIQMITEDGEAFDRGQVASIPVARPGAGGFLTHFNIEPGDLGWIKSNDRDISLFLKSFAKSPPNDNRIHDFSSAVFIPDCMTGYTVSPDAGTGMSIQNKDGSIAITLSPDLIKIKHPALVEIDAASTVFNGNVTMNNNLTINGVTSAQQIFSTEVIGVIVRTTTGINLGSHIHFIGTIPTGPPV